MSYNKLIEFVEQEYIDNFIRGRLIPASTGNSIPLMASLSQNFLQSSTSALSAICVLGKLEFGDEPLILARTIFEYSVHHAYIHAGGDVRAKAFVGKGYEEQKRRRSELSELKDQGKCHEMVEAIDAAISQENFPDIKKDWGESTGLQKMAKELGEPYECDWYFIYWSLSKAAHPNDINTIPSNPAEDAKRALLLGFNYHYRIAQKVCENLEHELNAKAQEFLRLVNDEGQE